MTQRRRVGILISGSGTNMAALLDAMQHPDYPAEPALVISNNPEAGGLAKAAAFGVQAVDTTAAGDTFCGTLAVALGEGQSLSEAVRFASAASALSVTKIGAQPSIPNRDEIDAFLVETC